MVQINLTDLTSSASIKGAATGIRNHWGSQLERTPAKANRTP
jgi:hypothetical protein